MRTRVVSKCKIFRCNKRLFQLRTCIQQIGVFIDYALILFVASSYTTEDLIHQSVLHSDKSLACLKEFSPRSQISCNWLYYYYIALLNYAHILHHLQLAERIQIKLLINTGMFKSGHLLVNMLIIYYWTQKKTFLKKIKIQVRCKTKPNRKSFIIKYIIEFKAFCINLKQYIVNF